LVKTDSEYHNDLIIDQFTKQAIPFTQNAAHSAEYAIKRLVTLSNVSKKDTVLDVACGSGLISCELARVVHHVTGIDITHDRTGQFAKTTKESMQYKICNWRCNTFTIW
jgi:2-polyprenyl-3-methyl-5-hydroxy-6-metoxy-1,4-benzoquinol methylase